MVRAKRCKHYDSSFALRADDELVTVRVYIFRPRTDEFEIEPRYEHGEGHVKFGPRKTDKIIKRVSQPVAPKAKVSTGPSQIYRM